MLNQEITELSKGICMFSNFKFKGKYNLLFSGLKNILGKHPFIEKENKTILFADFQSGILIKKNIRQNLIFLIPLKSYFYNR